DTTEIDDTDSVLYLCELQRSFAVTDRGLENGVAIAHRRLRRKRAFDFSERPLPHPRVLSDRLLLLRRSHLDLRDQGAALIDRRDKIGAQTPNGVALVLQYK